MNARLGAMRRMSWLRRALSAQPIQSNDDIANAFDEITYEKGAAVIEMFERWIGPEQIPRRRAALSQAACLGQRDGA